MVVSVLETMRASCPAIVTLVATVKPLPSMLSRDPGSAHHAESDSSLRHHVQVDAVAARRRCGSRPRSRWATRPGLRTRSRCLLHDRGDTSESPMRRCPLARGPKRLPFDGDGRAGLNSVVRCLFDPWRQERHEQDAVARRTVLPHDLRSRCQVTSGTTATTRVSDQ